MKCLVSRSSTAFVVLTMHSEGLRMIFKMQNADFYHNRGFSYRKRGEFDKAVADYTLAIKLNPSHCRAYYNRAFSYDRCVGGQWLRTRFFVIECVGLCQSGILQC